MSLLFDTTPDEPERRKTPARARKKVVATEEAAPPPEKTPSFIGQRPTQRLGTIDGHYQCWDDSCGSTAMDIIDEQRGEWRLECAVCGTGSREPALVGHLAPPKEEFVFRDGRFAGHTIAEAIEQPRGLDYIQWAAKDHPRQAVRDACKTHLDTLQPAT
jgi:hypothetical protein